MQFNQIYHGDCFNLINELPDDAVDLVFTSPPYSDRRKGSYGGVDPDRYVEWFLPLSAELLRVLKPTGSFVLNIKENVVDGERHTYVLELILAMRQQGWRWTEGYIWCKSNTMPGRWPTRLRDAWEHCLHFTKQPHFDMYQDEVKVAPTAATVARGRSLSAADYERQESAVGSGFGATMVNCTGHDLVLPSNVLHLSAETSNVGHSAAFPRALPQFFIKLFTTVGDLVLDPFAGVGTTCLVAKALGRDFLGFEIDPQYHELADTKITPQPLCDGAIFFT
jgi:site-specific DNA-methyltransferase (adenine-specific)